MFYRLSTTLAGKVGQLTDHVTQLPLREMQCRALLQCCDYIEAKMPLALGFKNQAACIRYALDQVGALAGTFMEFGVYKGASIRKIGSAAGNKRTVHGFDSFEGLPTGWFGNNLKAGAFDMAGRLPKVLPNTTLHKGWFDDTLPKWCAEHNDMVAFLNVDSDLYSSAVTIFKLLASRLQEGTIIHFDEYFNYPGWQQHEAKAWRETVERLNIDYTYLAYSRYGAVVRIDRIARH